MTKPLAVLAFCSAVLALSVFSRPVIAEEAPPVSIKSEATILLQNDTLLKARAADVSAVGQYFKSVRKVFSQTYPKDAPPEAVNMVLAVKPDRKARVWFVSSLKNPPDRSQFMAQFDALPVPEVKNGPVALVEIMTIGGARRQTASGRRLPMFPPEWTKQFGNRRVIFPDAITLYIWKD
jgi:hypothetical protein